MPLYQNEVKLLFRRKQINFSLVKHACIVPGYFLIFHGGHSYSYYIQFFFISAALPSAPVLYTRDMAGCDQQESVSLSEDTNTEPNEENQMTETIETPNYEEAAMQPDAVTFNNLIQPDLSNAFYR